MNEVHYEKIASRGRFKRTLFTNNSTWMGPDHLLLIEVDGYTENYKRFFFRDIKSVVVRLDNRRRNVNIFCGIFAAVGIAGLVLANQIEYRFSWGVFTLLFLISVLVNSLKGPSCICHILTPIQFDEIQGLRRLRKAEKILERIREAVAAEQPLLTQTEIAARFAAQSPIQLPGTTPPPLPSAVPPLI